jgi:hypothetical protein
MTAYVLNSTGANTSNLSGGTMTPGLPGSLSDGMLLILHTGVNSLSLGKPTISNWPLLAAFTSAVGEALYAHIFTTGDAAPSFSWDGSHQAFSRIAAFTGDVYTDLASIVISFTERSANTHGSVSVNSLSSPALSNALLLRGGHTGKTSVNNSTVFADWDTNPGIFTKIGSDIVQGGSAIAGTWWYWQQTDPLGISTDISDLPTTEPAVTNSQGWTIALKTAGTSLPVGEENYPDFHTRRSSHAAVQQFWSVPDTITSLPVSTLPPPATDFPMPARRQPQLSAFEVPTNRLPLGTDRVLSSALWDYEWDKPSLPVALRAESTGFTALELFATTNLPPYQEFNWPVPPGPRQYLRDFQASFNKNLIGQDALPPGGPQKNMWDPPRGPKRPVENLSSLDSGLSLYYFVPPKPVGAQSQDLPPTSASRLRPDFSQGLEAERLTFLSTLPPFLPCMDLPPIKRRRLMSLSYDYNGSLLYLKINTIPIGRSVQENPRLSRRARSSSLYEITPYAFLNPPSPPPGPPASSGQIAGPGGRIILMPKKVGETVIRPFDFISRLGGSEKILSAVVTASVYSGTDSSPQNIINGSAAISGTIVNQSLTGGLLGVIYELLCTITTSLGQRLEMSAFWVVEPDLP